MTFTAVLASVCKSSGQPRQPAMRAYRYSCSMHACACQPLPIVAAVEHPPRPHTPPNHKNTTVPPCAPCGVRAGAP